MYLALIPVIVPVAISTFTPLQIYLSSPVSSVEGGDDKSYRTVHRIQRMVIIVQNMG